MARSRLLPVVLVLPWLKSCATSCTLTPLPTAVEATPVCVEAKISPNSVREALKPTVCELARLFEVTERSWVAALRPVRAMLKDMEGLLGRCSGAVGLREPPLLQADHAGERHGAVVRGEIERRVGGIHDNALHFGGNERRESRVRRAIARGRADLVLPGRGCGTIHGLAVPDEIGEAGRGRSDLETVDERAAGVGDRHRDQLRTVGRDHRPGDTATGGAEVGAGRWGEHGLPDQGRAIGHL